MATQMSEPTYQIGYTSPMWRPADPFQRATEETRANRLRPFPEEEPRSYLDEYIQFILDGDLEESRDEMLVGFTAPMDLPF